MEPWTSLFGGLLPKAAEISETALNGDLILSSDWILDTDPTRPRKRSKTLRFILSRELLEDYARQRADHQTQIQRAVVRMMVDAIEAFDPGHNNPADMPPPTIAYVIGSDLRIRPQ